MPETQRRSTFVTVLGWVFVVLSGLYIAISILQGSMIHMLLGDPEVDRAMLALLAARHGVPLIVTFMVNHPALYVAILLSVSIVMLIASVGLLKRRNWARLCFIGIMVLALVDQLAALGMQFSLFPIIRQELFGPPSHAGTSRLLDTIGVIVSLGFVVLYGWIVKKLVSTPLAAEFRQ